MKKWIPFIIVIGLLGWAVFDFVTSKNQGETPNGSEASNDEDIVIGINVGNKAPDFELKTLDGNTLKLSDFQGKRVMINFWATWCPPCRAEMPDMEKFYQDKDIVILAINLTDSEKSREDVEKFVDENDLTFPVLLDENLEVADLYAIKPIPTSYMVDSNGLISYKALGPMNYDIMVQEFEKME